MRMESAQSEVVTFQGDEVVATLPEGTQRKMKLPDLLRKMTDIVPDTRGAILPDGVKSALPFSGGVILVHQTPPQVYSFQWISDDSSADFGPGTEYRTVRLALPYVVVLAVFFVTGRRGGIPVLSGRNECFFSNDPLEAKGLDTPLAYPALLNCSKMDGKGGGPFSWICTQHLSSEEFAEQKTLDASLRQGLTALLRHLLESGFNRSSENHEGASGFGASVEAEIDPRIASVEAWEAATRDDPLFALEVPWLPSGMTLGELASRVTQPGRARARTIDSAADLVRLVFNSTNTPRTRK
jgi:hypothetical protein